MDFAYGVLAAFIFSVIMEIIQAVKTAKGVLRIDRTNPNKETYRFEIDDLDSLAKKKRVVLKVDNKAHISQD